MKGPYRSVPIDKYVREEDPKFPGMGVFGPLVNTRRRFAYDLRTFKWSAMKGGLPACCILKFILSFAGYSVLAIDLPSCAGGVSVSPRSRSSKEYVDESKILKYLVSANPNMLANNRNTRRLDKQQGQSLFPRDSGDLERNIYRFERGMAETRDSLSQLEPPTETVCTPSSHWPSLVIPWLRGLPVYAHHCIEEGTYEQKCCIGLIGLQKSIEMPSLPLHPHAKKQSLSCAHINLLELRTIAHLITCHLNFPQSLSNAKLPPSNLLAPPRNPPKPQPLPAENPPPSNVVAPPL